MSQISIIDQQRSTAIGRALAMFLDAEQTLNAMLLWQEKYSGNPGISVQYFARECCQRFCQEADRNGLVKKLLREIYSQLHALDHIQLDKPQ